MSLSPHLSTSRFSSNAHLMLLVLCLLLTAVHAVDAKKDPAKASSGPTKAEQRKAKKAEAMQALQAQAEAGDAQAQTIVALSYLKGRGVPKDPQKGLTMLEAASEKGCQEATTSLIDIYTKGRYGIAKNPARVEALYTKLGIASPNATKAAFSQMQQQFNTLLQSDDERARFINSARHLNASSPLQDLASAVVEGTRLMEKAHSRPPAVSENGSAPAAVVIPPSGTR